MGTDGPTHPLFTKQHQALRDELRRVEDEVEGLQRELMDEDYWCYPVGSSDFKGEVLYLFETAARLLHLHNRAAEIRAAMEKLAKSPVADEAAEL